MQRPSLATTDKPAPAVAGGAPQPPQPADVQSVVARFAPVGLGQMDAVALQNRTDTKYVLSTRQLAETLQALVGEYRVLEIDGVRLNPYQTVYFDTPDFALYLQHHAGKYNRYKVRSRRYLVTGQSFIEVKLKTNKDRTVKRRLPTDGLATSATPALAGFVAAHARASLTGLEPKLWNEFSRITLVSTARQERLTIDLDLRFRNDDRSVALPGLAIAEVKQAGLSRRSTFIEHMHAAAIQPTGFSKYCIGVALLYPHIKHNRFKSKLNLIHKLIEDPRNVN